MSNAMSPRRYPRSWQSGGCQTLFTWSLSLAMLLGPAICQPGTNSMSSHALPLQHVGDFPLPGRATRWDYLSLDPVRSRLFIAHLGDNEIVVMDIKTKTVLATIGNAG